MYLEEDISLLADGLLKAQKYPLNYKELKVIEQTSFKRSREKVLKTGWTQNVLVEGEKTEAYHRFSKAIPAFNDNISPLVFLEIDKQRHGDEHFLPKNTDYYLLLLTQEGFTENFGNVDFNGNRTEFMMTFPDMTTQTVE